VKNIEVDKIAGKHVVGAGSGEETVRVFGLASRQQIALLEDHQASVRSVAVAEIAGKHVVVSGSDDGTLRRWSLTPRGLEVAEKLCIVPSTGSVIALKPDGAGGDLLLHASPDAWRDFAAEYHDGDRVEMTDIEDMPRAASVSAVPPPTPEPPQAEADGGNPQASRRQPARRSPRRSGRSPP
jgi:WD40 repeat protein